MYPDKEPLASAYKDELQFTATFSNQIDLCMKSCSPCQIYIHAGDK